MQRYNLNLKGGTYTQGDVYTAVPILRQQVVPGQTVNLNVDCSLKSAALLNNVTMPSIMSMWFFYVPHRLIFDGWTDYVSQEEGKPTIPRELPANFIFESGTVNVNTFARRAYKLIYNEYFGTEGLTVGPFSYAWVSDITADGADNIANRLRTPSQFLSKLVTEDISTDPEFSVSGSTIPLNEFYRQMMNARSQQRAQMTGNKYGDTLNRMGVDASWMIAERPEFLGTKSKMVGPVLTSNTSATETGFEVGRYQAKLNCEIKGKHFAEHGYIIGIAGMRPILTNPDENPADVFFGEPSAGTLETPVYLADNLQTRDDVSKFTLGLPATADDGYTQRFSYLQNGQWLTGKTNAASWITTYDPQEISNTLYPLASEIGFSNELGGDQIALTTSFVMTGKTPVKKSVA